MVNQAKGKKSKTEHEQYILLNNLTSSMIHLILKDSGIVFKDYNMLLSITAQLEAVRVSNIKGLDGKKVRPSRLKIFNKHIQSSQNVTICFYICHDQDSNPWYALLFNTFYMHGLTIITVRPNRKKGHCMAKQVKCI